MLLSCMARCLQAAAAIRGGASRRFDLITLRLRRVLGEYLMRRV